MLKQFLMQADFYQFFDCTIFLNQTWVQRVSLKYFWPVMWQSLLFPCISHFYSYISKFSQRNKSAHLEEEAYWLNLFLLVSDLNCAELFGKPCQANYRKKDCHVYSVVFILKLVWVWCLEVKTVALRKKKKLTRVKLVLSINFKVRKEESGNLNFKKSFHSFLILSCATLMFLFMQLRQLYAEQLKISLHNKF